MIYRRLGQDEKAQADFNRAIEIANGELAANSNNWDALSDRDRTYRLMGEFELALADLNRALAIAPRTAWLEEERQKALQEISE